MSYIGANRTTHHPPPLFHHLYLASSKGNTPFRSSSFDKSQLHYGHAFTFKGPMCVRIRIHPCLNTPYAALGDKFAYPTFFQNSSHTESTLNWWKVYNRSKCNFILSCPHADLPFHFKVSVQQVTTCHSCKSKASASFSLRGLWIWVPLKSAVFAFLGFHWHF